MGSLIGVAFGVLTWFLVRHGVFGFFTVKQNERAVLTSFGRAQRRRRGGKDLTTLDDSVLAENLNEGERQRYAYPLLVVIPPGGPYFKFPWQRVYKVSVATATVNIAYDPESPEANSGGTELEAVTKDQLNTGLTGQLRYTVSERNLYAYLFGVKNPIAHVLGFFISILRERIANFEAQHPVGSEASAATELAEGISINDLRKNLRQINEHMETECGTAPARYGIELDAALITGINPPNDVESALAAINTAHNHVSSDISVARAAADQKIVQSKRAVEIETLNAQAEVEPLRALAAQLTTLKAAGAGVLEAYVRNQRRSLLGRARRAILEVKS